MLAHLDGAHGVEGLCEVDVPVVLEADLDAFEAALTSESHTLKRALTDPRILSGIGNSYSDEILHRARLSPFRLTRSLTPEEMKIVEPIYNDLYVHYNRSPEDAKKLIAFGESKADPSLDVAYLAAYTMVVNQLLNLDEVLNK